MKTTEINDADKKIHRRCPGCKLVQQARLRECYDRCYIFFPCGTWIDCQGDDGPVWTRGANCKTTKKKRG
jgi:hypothetical protein